jgi:HAD superfamily hydrolase (TIGR01509 family)
VTHRAVLWDLDGTLADTEPLHGLAFEKAAFDFGLKIPANFHDSMLGRSDQQIFEELNRVTGARLDLQTWRRAKFAHFSRQPDLVTLRHNVGDIPERLHKHNVLMAVVSNSTKDEVAFILRASGLDRLFQHTISRADVAAGKPEPDSYLLAATRLGCAPTECVVVEDSKVGSTAGVNAGMTVIFHPQTATDDIPKNTFYLPHTESLWPVLADRLDLHALAAEPKASA